MTVVPVDVVPMTANCGRGFSYTEKPNWAVGTTARETIGSKFGLLTVPPLLTAKTEVPSTAVPSGLWAMAVIPVTPVMPATASPGSEPTTPVVPIVATDRVLELQTTGLIVAPPIVAELLVRFTVAPEEVVPIAMY